MADRNTQTSELERAVLDAAMARFVAEATDLVTEPELTAWSDAVAAQKKACEALHARRHPTTTPKPRCEPLPAFQQNRFHWLTSELGETEPFFWTQTGRWKALGRSGEWSAESAADDGYSWIGICAEPESPVQPAETIEDLRETVED